MNVSKHIVRTITSSAKSAAAVKGEIHPGYHRLSKIQERFQVNDGKPVFLKAGATDAILYRITMALSLLGLGGIGKLFYDLSYPKTD